MRIKWYATGPAQNSATVGSMLLLVEKDLATDKWACRIFTRGAPTWSLGGLEKAADAKTETEREARIIASGARDHLRRFTTDGIVSDEQKKALKAAGWIDYRHGMWGLTDAGKTEAERLGYQ